MAMRERAGLMLLEIEDRFACTEAHAFEQPRLRAETFSLRTQVGPDGPDSLIESPVMGNVDRLVGYVASAIYNELRLASLLRADRIIPSVDATDATEQFYRIRRRGVIQKLIVTDVQGFAALIELPRHDDYAPHELGLRVSKNILSVVVSSTATPEMQSLSSPETADQ